MTQTDDLKPENDNTAHFQAQISTFNERYEAQHQLLLSYPLFLAFSFAAQNDEIARLQLDNNILQEKITNEKRKVSILQVEHLSVYSPRE